MFSVTAGLGGSRSVALNVLIPIPTTDGDRALLRMRLVDSLDACFRDRRLPTERIKMPKRGGELGFSKNLSNL
jgi:hypothetical protein